MFDVDFCLTGVRGGGGAIAAKSDEETSSKKVDARFWCRESSVPIFFPTSRFRSGIQSRGNWNGIEEAGGIVKGVCDGERCFPDTLKEYGSKSKFTSGEFER